QLAAPGWGRVRRPVVDDDHLVGLPQPFHDIADTGEQRPDVVLLVVDRDDDGERETRRAPLTDGPGVRGRPDAHAFLWLAARSSPRLRFRPLREARPARVVGV